MLSLLLQLMLFRKLFNMFLNSISMPKHVILDLSLLLGPRIENLGAL